MHANFLRLGFCEIERLHGIRDRGLKVMPCCDVILALKLKLAIAMILVSLIEKVEDHWRGPRSRYPERSEEI